MFEQDQAPFWKRKRLEEMTREEWESLCDGCARCCLHKLEDIDTKQVFYTRVVCRLLDQHTCQCANYPERSRLVPTCLQLTTELIHELKWLPRTCAYRLIAEGRDLAWWHPLVCGDHNVIHELGISVRDYAISEDEIDMDQLEDYVDEDDELPGDIL